MVTTDLTTFKDTLAGSVGGIAGNDSLSLLAALADTAIAQNSSMSAALDASLRGAVDRKDAPGAR
jgi:hypothetical protein